MSERRSSEGAGNASVGVADQDGVATPAAPAAAGDGLAQQILRAVRGLRYGSVEITIHDGEVVQIERREKVRLDRRRGDRAG
ncbi:MAG TPA: YezD family protein [Patescibacteria group bacterium]|nr:YezD family protein [Patescibacteria group bacterium]